MEILFNQIIVIDKISNTQLTWEVRHETTAWFTGICSTNVEHAASQQVADYVIATTVTAHGTLDILKYTRID